MVEHDRDLPLAGPRAARCGEIEPPAPGVQTPGAGDDVEPLLDSKRYFSFLVYMMLAFGIGIGLALIVNFSFVAGNLVYGVSPLDPVTFVGVLTVLGAVALFANYVPARRAARVDPMIALRRD